MRKKLKEIEETRITIIGEFSRKGVKNGYKGTLETLLMVNIRDLEGKLLAEHLWFNYTKGFEKLGELKEGDKIQLDGRSKSYIKGYKGYRQDVYKPLEEDFKLSHPTKIKKIEEENNEKI